MKLLVLFVYAIFAVLAFGKLPFTFFQQDEWAIFGNFLVWDKASLGIWDRLFVYEQDTHIIPFSNLVSYLQFKLFELNFSAYAIFSIVLHSINSFLVYYLADILTKNKKISFLAGFLFLISAIPHQAITWVATTVGTVGSTFFILLSLISFTYFLMEKKRHRYILLSLLFIIISLGFKETSLFLFLFFPMIWFLFTKEKELSLLVKVFSPFGIFGVFYMLLRLYFVLFGYKSTSPAEAVSQASLPVYLYRLFSVPLKFIAQSFIPVPFIVTSANNLVRLAYPQFLQDGVANPYIVESVASDIISYVIVLALLTVSLTLAFQLKKKKEIFLVRTIFICLIFILLGSLPFILIPGKAGYFSLLDGRHLYLTNIFASIFIVCVGYGLYTILPWKKLTVAGLTILFMYITYSNVMKIRTDLNQQMGTGFIRKKILNTIYTNYPSLPKNVVFYIEGDKSYYGLPVNEKIVPFQSGFGQTLLVWYNTHGNTFPACLFKEKYLYVLLSEGYKECEGRGFGYFRKIDTLSEAVATNKIPSENIIAFTYNSSTSTLTDITSRIRKDLQQ